VIDVPSLERRWIKYKIKRSIPYLLGIVGIGTASIVLFYNLDRGNTAPPPTLKQEVSTVEIAQKQTVVEEPKEAIVPPMPTVQQPVSVVAPPITAARPDPVQPSVAWKPTVSPAPKNAPVSLVTPKGAQMVTVTSPVVVQPNTRNNPVSIKQEATPFDIHEIEDRFKNNSNPHLGLYIARYHYDNGNYHEAYNYALKTNAINNSLEESWIIFAKSLVKLGRTEQAKKTLQLYISQSNSEEAKSLLNNLNKEDEK